MRYVTILLIVLSGCSSPADPPVVIDTDAGLWTASDARNDGANASSCGPASCDGCCDDEGHCRLGQDVAVCGVGGAACGDCGAETCRDGVCLSPGCGDGVLSPDERCDALEVPTTCVDLGFAGGTVSCSSGCEIDTTQCEAYTCETAQANGASCDFCDPDGSTLTRCAFCRGPLLDGSPRDDETQTCAAGTSCFAWQNPDNSDRWADCLDAPPVRCQQADVDYCAGDFALSCGHDGRERRQDCADRAGGQCITYQDPDTGLTRSTCIDERSTPCSSVDARTCDGDELVMCGPSGYTSHLLCDPPGGPTAGECVEDATGAGCFEVAPACSTPGQSCNGAELVECAPILGGTLLRERIVQDCSDLGFDCSQIATGPQCTQPGTSACDGSTYVETCQGDRWFKCHNVSGWEVYTDCALDGQSCHDIAGVGPRCAPPNYTPCDFRNTPPSCAGSTASRCIPFDFADPAGRGWVDTFDCPALNPICVADGVVGCVSAPETDCVPGIAGPDDYIETGIAQGCDGAQIVVCDINLKKEFRHDCQADGSNWICKPPDGTGCMGDPCWCARP